MRKLYVLLTLAGFIALAAFRKNGAADNAYPVPPGWPKPAYEFTDGPLNAARVALGRRLFFEPLLSRDNTISCASCHLPQTAFTHIDHDLSHGIEGRIGKRNAPALMNLAWARSFSWDGAVHHLDMQSLAPITNPLEMDETIGNVVHKLAGAATYRSAFQKAFGDEAVTGERLLKALSQFMLTAVSCDAKYDRVKQGKASFNEWETKGYALFKANCNSCHTEPLFTNGAFENNGLREDTSLNDSGRMAATHLDADRGKFKVPSLRNVEVSYPYMHDGRFRSLQMVLFHYSNDIHRSANTAPQLADGIPLSEDDKRCLIAFLKTLTDEGFLHNLALQPPVESD